MEDEMDLLEGIAEAISKGGILIDDVKMIKNSKNGWKKISFCYKFGNKMTDRDKEIEKLSKKNITETEPFDLKIWNKKVSIKNWITVELHDSHFDGWGPARVPSYQVRTHWSGYFFWGELIEYKADT